MALSDLQARLQQLQQQRDALVAQNQQDLQTANALLQAVQQRRAQIDAIQAELNNIRAQLQQLAS